MVAQLSIPVSNVVSLLGQGFTRIEVWKLNQLTSQYEEITNSAASGASLESNTAQTTFRMGGKTLSLKVNNASYTVTFSTLVDNWSPEQVANRINEVVNIATVSSGKVVLTTASTGRSSSLEITYCDSISLGFMAGQKAYGKDARITLSGGTVLYQYSDSAGSPGDSYKWRYSANGLSPISNFSAPVEGIPPVVAGINVSIATANFVGLDGRAKKMKVIIASDRPPVGLGGFAVGDERPQVYESDDLGFFQATLVKGMVVRVAIEGTAYVREITVPNTDTFDLLAALATAPDPFTVQVTPPFLTRRNI